MAAGSTSRQPRGPKAGGSPGRRRFVGAALGAACSLGTPLSARAARIVRPWPEAKPVPELALPALDGVAWRLPAALGQVVVANFWATWCEPCRVEMPSLLALAERLGPAGLIVVAINYRESAEKVKRFLEPRLAGLTVLLDADGDAASEWTPRVFPSTVVVGREGRPAFTVVGELDWAGDEALQLLQPLVAARPPPSLAR